MQKDILVGFIHEQAYKIQELDVDKKKILMKTRKETEESQKKYEELLQEVKELKKRRKFVSLQNIS